MILSAITVFIIEKDFKKAAFWSLGGAVLSWFGLMHSYQWTIADTVVNLGWGTGASWAVGYVLLAILFFYVSWQTRNHKE
jgi:AGZA family xanthine/uracil permease-like MFS transporter